MQIKLPLCLFVILTVGITLSGCSGKGYEIVKTSGTVKLNGKPLPNAHLTFQPMVKEGGLAGPFSTGVTDANGVFTLKSIKGDDGAVVGKHKVLISTAAFPKNAANTSDDSGSSTAKEKVPARYNIQTTLEIEVPAGGTDKADFLDLKSP